MSKLEELTAASLEADRELEQQKELLRRLETELQENGPALSCRDYGDLRSNIAQQTQRVEVASRAAREKQDALDEARSAEVAKLQREAAQRTVDTTLSRLNETRAALESKRAELNKIQNELPALARQQSFLLAELDRARTQLQQLQPLEALIQ